MEQRNVSENSKFVIMIAEDRKDQALFISRILSEQDYRVICVDDGLRALQLIVRGVIPHILVTDLKMPTVTGFRVARSMP